MIPPEGGTQTGRCLPGAIRRRYGRERFEGLARAGFCGKGWGLRSVRHFYETAVHLFLCQSGPVADGTGGFDSVVTRGEDGRERIYLNVSGSAGIWAADAVPAFDLSGLAGAEEAGGENFCRRDAADGLRS